MKNMSLKSKIYACFAIFACLLIVTALTGYVGQSRLRAATQEIEDIDRAEADVLRLDRDVQELRLRIDRYIASGQDFYRSEVQRIRDRIDDQIGQILADQTNPEVSDLVTQMQVHLNASYEKFLAITEERTLRERLVMEQLPQQATVVESALQELKQQFRDDPAVRYELTRIQESFSNAEKQLLRYFEDPDTGTVNEASRQIKVATTVLGPLDDLGAGKPELLASIQEFERTGLRAVQATRSYLFFRNVVMAGEASEVTHYSKALRELTAERHERIAADVSATSDAVIRSTTLMTAVALLLSLVIAARVVFLVVPPVTRLANTFERLSSGETLAEIPGTDRQDEIGHMSRAAEVFSRQNLETRRLLEESEELRTEIESKAEDLEATNQELDQFAYVASHDLKSPLRGIRQLATWIEEDSGDQIGNDSLQHLRLMSDRVTKMESLLTDLLEYSRAGRVADEPEIVNVAELLQVVVDLTDNPNNVSIEWANDIPLLQTVRTPLDQVLRNLVANAVKHNDRGDEGIVRVDWMPIDDKTYQLSVVDNGPGIDESNHQRVFQMYQRVGDQAVPGSGMGLAIVKKQIEQLGGHISLTSKLGEGARFDFTWPAVRQSGAHDEN